MTDGTMVTLISLGVTFLFMLGVPVLLVIGYWVWGDWPDWQAFFGTGLIIGSGLIVLVGKKRTTICSQFSKAPADHWSD